MAPMAINSEMMILKFPQNWEEIVGIRRGHLPRREPFMMPPWDDYWVMTATSIKRSARHFTLPT